MSALPRKMGSIKRGIQYLCHLYRGIPCIQSKTVLLHRTTYYPTSLFGRPNSNLCALLPKRLTALTKPFRSTLNGRVRGGASVGYITHVGYVEFVVVLSNYISRPFQTMSLSDQTKFMELLASGGKDEPALSRADPAGTDVKEPEVKMDGDRRVMSVDEWTSRWEVGKIGFHKENRHTKLERFLEDLVKGRKELKFFFPLCGKTIDMKWMYDEGHTVVGVEASITAVEEFFLDNDLTYIADTVDAVGGSVYKTEDNRIRIYCCDFFKFTSDVEKDFTAFFDRGALVAINREDRVRYANLMMSLMAPDARYMLLTFDYDRSKYPGPPHYLSLEDLEELYGSKCNLELINVEDAYEPRHKDWGIETLDERVHILTLKQ